MQIVYIRNSLKIPFFFKKHVLLQRDNVLERFSHGSIIHCPASAFVHRSRDERSDHIDAVVVFCHDHTNSSCICKKTITFVGSITFQKFFMYIVASRVFSTTARNMLAARGTWPRTDLKILLAPFLRTIFRVVQVSFLSMTDIQSFTREMSQRICYALPHSKKFYKRWNKDVSLEARSCEALE